MHSSRREALGLMMSGLAAVCMPQAAFATTAGWAAPGEFEPQDFIWLSWREQGFLGSAPFSDVATEIMKAVTPAVKVRLLYSDEEPPYSFGTYRAKTLPRVVAETRIRAKLQHARVDVSRVEFIFYSKAFGAIQDPGPFFLRNAEGELAIADYRYDHPDPRSEAMDRAIAGLLGLPTVSSTLVSEGGGRQSNGRGTLMLVKSVERARNPDRSIDEIEREHLRVHAASKVIWLEEGPADEEWGRLEDGRFGIGTGGHVDVFARFSDPSTVLLAEVSAHQRDTYPIAAKTFARRERNLEILRDSTDQDGRPLRVLRVPVPDPLIASYDYDRMTSEEKFWFEGARAGDRVEFYLPAGYLNFIIANDVIVSARLHGQGRDDRYARSDAAARAALEQAFPGRTIVEVGVEPLLRDGAGLHCHSRNQPAASVLSP